MGYLKNKFSSDKMDVSCDDAPHIKTYERYVTRAISEGAFEVLQKHLVQLQFPIQKGISQTDDYKNATLKGRSKTDDYGLALESRQDIGLKIYDSPLIGKVPVITIPNYTDFQTVICALAHRNEPVKIPHSMGAAFLKGLNNWGRINTLKNEFLGNNPNANWACEFKQRILPMKELYQDELIVLSTKPYSNVSGSKLGVDKHTWNSYSYQIRLAHECAHLFTLRHYGEMANNIHDEIVADYVGISTVIGQFNAKWFLHFMGIENYPNYRNGGRLQNYVEGLSHEAVKAVQFIVKQAAHNISTFDSILGQVRDDIDKVNRVRSICETDLIVMAMGGGAHSLLDRYNSFSLSISH